jgi:hypothetical protein
MGMFICILYGTQTLTAEPTLTDQDASPSPAEPRSPKVQHQIPEGSKEHKRQETETSVQIRSRRTTGEVMSRTESRGQSINLRRVATTMLVPEKKVGPAPGFFKSIYAILINSCAFGITMGYRMRLTPVQ